MIPNEILLAAAAKSRIGRKRALDALEVIAEKLQDQFDPEITDAVATIYSYLTPNPRNPKNPIDWVSLPAFAARKVSDPRKWTRFVHVSRGFMWSTNGHYLFAIPVPEGFAEGSYMLRTLDKVEDVLPPPDMTKPWPKEFRSPEEIPQISEWKQTIHNRVEYLKIPGRDFWIPKAQAVQMQPEKLLGLDGRAALFRTPFGYAVIARALAGGEK